MPMRLYSAKRSRATTWISHFGCVRRAKSAAVMPAMPLPTITMRLIDASHCTTAGCAAAVAASGVSATDTGPRTRAQQAMRVLGPCPSRTSVACSSSPAGARLSDPSTTAIGSAPQMPIRQPDSSASPQRSASSSTVASRSAPTRCPAGRKVTSIAARLRSAANAAAAPAPSFTLCAVPFSSVRRTKRRSVENVRHSHHRLSAPNRPRTSHTAHSGSGRPVSRSIASASSGTACQ